MYRADAALHQPPGQQAAMGKGRVAVFLANRLRLVADIEHIRGFELHVVSRLHRLDAAFQILVLPELLLVILVQRLNQIQLPPLRFFIQFFVLQVPDHLVRLGHRIVEESSLVFRRQESRARQTVASALARRQHHEARQIFVLAAQPVGDPRAHGRPRRRDVARVEQAARRRMRRVERIHRLDHADVVDGRRDIRQQAADVHAAAAHTV